MNTENIIGWMVAAVMFIMLAFVVASDLKATETLKAHTALLQEIDHNITILTCESVLVEAMNARDITEAQEIEEIRKELRGEGGEMERNGEKSQPVP